MYSCTKKNQARWNFPLGYFICVLAVRRPAGGVPEADLFLHPRVFQTEKRVDWYAL